MAENSKIEWCDHTFNPWRGCTKVSPGCANCYAETLSKRHPSVLGEWGKGKPRVLASQAMWQQPRKWEAAQARHQAFMNGTAERPRVFCASLADWLDIEVPDLWLTRLLELIGQTPNLDWLLLTKRPELWSIRMGDVIGSSGAHAEDALWPHEGAALAEDWVVRGNAPPNVWLGTSVEDQTRADERIPQLLQIPAKVRFLSCEPLLGPVDLRLNDEFPSSDGCYEDARHGLHWVIAGGESGPHARPMHPDWARSLRDQCQAASVPFLFKQWGNHLPVCPFYGNDDEHDGLDLDKLFVMEPSGYQVLCVNDRYEHQPRHGSWLFETVGKKRAGRQLDGRTWDQFPDSATPATPLASPHTETHPQP